MSRRPLRVDIVATLQAGQALLAPVLEAHGFRFVSGEAGHGSGGSFARGAFVRGDRQLSFSFRYTLGEVVYCVGGMAVPHEWYMRAKLGGAGGNEYPGYSSDPLDGFRHLAHDLAAHCSEFLIGSDAAFRTIFEQARTLGNRRGFGALP